jgi:hypothetical protein
MTRANTGSEKKNHSSQHDFDAMKYLDSAADEFKKVEKMVRKNVQENPLLTLGGALAVGYLAGYLVRQISVPSRNSSELLSH